MIHHKYLNEKYITEENVKKRTSDFNVKTKKFNHYYIGIKRTIVTINRNETKYFDTLFEYYFKVFGTYRIVNDHYKMFPFDTRGKNNKVNQFSLRIEQRDNGDIVNCNIHVE